jgi:peptidoglycan/xylan/chitin deacetylase (PgdA/CDA1 family)
MRSLAKHAIESILVGSGIAAAGRRRRAGDALILAYHNVLPDADAARSPDSLHLPHSRFLEQLDQLEALARVVPLQSILEAPGASADADPPAAPSSRWTGAGLSGSEGSARPRVVLTFDDAYRGAVDLALPELERRRLPATVFVCPGLLDADAFWWDAFDARGREDRIFGELAADHEAVLAFLGAEGAPRKPASEWRRPARRGELEPYLRSSHGVVAIGGHSWSHPNLAGLDDAQLVSQLSRTWSWLSREVARPSPWLACPYGLNSEAVGREAKRIGYRGALEIAGAWVPAGGWDPFRTPRLNVPAGVSRKGFELRISGLIRH